MGPPLGAVQCEMQKLWLWMALTLRDDVEASVRRSALAFTLERRGTDPASAGGYELHAAAPADVDARIQVEAQYAQLPASVLRAALLRVDSALPESALLEHLTRVYGETYMAAVAAAAKTERAAAAAADPAVETAATLAALSLSANAETLPPLPLLLSRLLSEPLRRFSARTHTELAGRIEAALRTAQAKAGKKGKGKKAKAGEAAVVGVPQAAVREAIGKADATRPAFEAEWLASRCIRSARAAAARTEYATTIEAMATDQAPLEAIITELYQALVQPTTARADAA